MGRWALFILILYVVTAVIAIVMVYPYLINVAANLVMP